MKTQYYTASSLDGFIADREHGLEWLFQFADEPIGDYAAFIGAIGAIAMGSHTYEWILRHQAGTGAEGPQPWPYTQPVWVFTTRELPRVPDADIRFARGDVRAVHAEMAAAAGGRSIWLTGGGELVGQFHDHGLLDEIIIDVASVTLGSGAPLLPRAIITPPLRLVSAERYSADFVRLVYEVSAERPG